MSEIVINEFGGKQSRVDARFDLVPPRALQAAALTLGHGAVKYGCLNWQQISVQEHLNHALNHINLYQLNDSSEEHLSHALVRLMMAFEIEQIGVQSDTSKRKTQTYQDPTNTQPAFDLSTIFGD